MSRVVAELAVALRLPPAQVDRLLAEEPVMFATVLDVLRAQSERIRRG